MEDCSDSNLRQFGAHRTLTGKHQLETDLEVVLLLADKCIICNRKDKALVCLDCKANLRTEGIY